MTYRYPAFSLLVVDDEPGWLESMALMLERSLGVNNLILCSKSEEALNRLEAGDVGLVLLDLIMPGLSGEELLKSIAENHPETLVIVISGVDQVDSAVNCMKLGAYDFFVKTTEQKRLVAGVKRAIRTLELQRENLRLKRGFLKKRLEHPEAFSRIITRDGSMLSIFSYVESVAKSSEPVLITGESGTGKELISHAIHDLSGRSGELVPVNVAGLDDNVFADTLFGHLRGAYTGAEKIRKGMLEQAQDGTLFLDEIGDLSNSSQLKLLRLTQEGEYFPLGSDRRHISHARMLVATNQDLADKLSRGEFRKDLYYRLRSHHLHIPPLRERKGDLPLLIEHFLARASEQFGLRIPPAVPPELLELLEDYPFPGNIRELRSMVFDALCRNQRGPLSLASFEAAIRDQPLPPGSESPAPTGTKDSELLSFHRRLPSFSQALELLCLEAVRRTRGNLTAAARLLGISRPALSKRLKKIRVGKSGPAPR